MDGSLYARYAVELAFAYAQAAGAEVRIVHVLTEHRLASLRWSHDRDDAPASAREHALLMEARLREELGPLAERWSVPMSIRGRGTSEIVERSGCTTAVVLPVT